MSLKLKKDDPKSTAETKKDNVVDPGIINQYETAMQLLNAELQKLLLINQQLHKENEVLKGQLQ